jgi:hypothetical protein
VDCGRIILSGHAVRRIFARALAQADILQVVRMGEVIERYPQDMPFPSVLVFGLADSGPLHVVVGKDDATDTCIVVTAYRPDPARWTPDFRKRLP